MSGRLLLPDRLFTRTLLARSVGIWIPVRIIELGAQATTRDPGMPPPTPFVPLLVALGIGALVGILLILDVRRRGEHVLLANLGTGTRDLLVLGVLFALSLELVVGVVGVALAADGG